MVGMSTFAETDHPRGQAANAGQFRMKENSAPTGKLATPSDRGENPILSGILRNAVAQDRRESPPIEDLRDTARYVLGALDDGEYDIAHSPGQLAHARRVLTRLVNFPPAHAPAAPVDWQGLLSDVNTMGGDEIRALDDDTLLRLDSYLLRAAARVQAATAERGLRHERTGSSTDVDQLELVDYRNVTEAQVSAAYLAGVSQGIAGGVLRTKDDFFNHAKDEHGEPDDEVVERAWATFQSEDGLQFHDQEGSWGQSEYEVWTTTVGEELDKARSVPA